MYFEAVYDLSFSCRLPSFQAIWKYQHGSHPKWEAVFLADYHLIRVRFLALRKLVTDTCNDITRSAPPQPPQVAPASVPMSFPMSSFLQEKTRGLVVGWVGESQRWLLSHQEPEGRFFDDVCGKTTSVVCFWENSMWAMCQFRHKNPLNAENTKFCSHCSHWNSKLQHSSEPNVMMAGSLRWSACESAPRQFGWQRPSPLVTCAVPRREMLIEMPIKGAAKPLVTSLNLWTALHFKHSISLPILYPHAESPISFVISYCLNWLFLPI